MFARVKTVAFVGIEAVFTNIEANLLSGIPSFTIVGLANRSVCESRERVRSALNMCGFTLPPKRIVINLSPADIQKDGNHYDLGIAMAILICMGVIEPEFVEDFIFIGELSLNGDINYVNGSLPTAILANSSNLGVVCGDENVPEVSFAGEGTKIISSSNLSSLIQNIKLKKFSAVVEASILNHFGESLVKDFSDVRGQKQAKRALEIASIGGHNILMIGRPGSGKSMLAERFAGIMPPLSTKEMLEVSIINSISGSFNKDKLSMKRPFRSPHHSSSMVALIGGGKTIKPGEISLAHNGVLFLDEFAEFPTFALDALREPMETNQVNIARAEGHVSFPCKFQLIAAMNPCKCGYLGDEKKECNRVPFCGESYIKKISGPILERIDIHINVNPTFDMEGFSVSYNSNEETSIDILQRIIKIRKFISSRGQDEFLNAKIPISMLSKFCKLQPDTESLLNVAANKFHFSMREYHKIIKLARTIADSDFKEEIQKDHILESLQFRRYSN